MNNPKMFYKVVDGYHEFADGELFETKADVIDQLASFHSIDWDGEDDEGNELSIEDYLAKLADDDKRLDFLIEHGQWDLEEVAGINCPFCNHPIEAKEQDGTHIWACPEACPFVAFEFVEQKDIDNLIKYLN